MSRKLLVLPTRELFLKFYETMRSVSVCDYRIEDLVEEIIGALFTDDKNLSTLVQLANWYKIKYGQGPDQPPEDAEIIARATFELGQGIYQQLVHHALYDDQGILHCEYYKNLTDDLVLQYYS